MNVSSEMIHSLLPIFIVTVLGTSMVTVGVIEGVAEATAAVMKIVSGTLSDYFGRRKFLMILGYGFAACTKPVFPLATSIGWVFAAPFVDRVGKSIRGAPRGAARRTGGCGFHALARRRYPGRDVGRGDTSFPRGDAADDICARARAGQPSRTGQSAVHSGR